MRLLEKRGVLTSAPSNRMRGGRVVRELDPNEVAAYAAAQRRDRAVDWAPGELAAEVFRAFDRGATMENIVRDFKLEPERVRSYYREYRAGDLEAGEKAREVEEREAADRGRLRDIGRALEGVGERAPAEPPDPDQEFMIWPVSDGPKPAEDEGRLAANLAPPRSARYVPGGPIGEAIRFALATVDPEAVAAAMLAASKTDAVKRVMSFAARALSAMFTPADVRAMQGPEPRKEEEPQP